MYSKFYKPLKHRVIWTLLGYTWVAIVIYFSLVPNPPVISVAEFGDKLEHLTAYFCLFSWFAQVFQRRYFFIPAILLILLGVTMEILQGLSGYRMFEYADMLANSMGVLIAWLLSYSKISELLIYFERVYLKHGH